MRFLWDFFIGPLLASLPVRWRTKLPGAGETDWARAGTVSGIYEMAAALVALGYWYMYEMTRRIGQIVEVLANQPSTTGATEHQIQGAALFLFYMSPLTWILFYFFIEGAVRLLGAAFTENVMGTLPLYLAERLIFLVRKPEEAHVAETVKGHARELAEGIHERMMVARLPELPDEVVELKIDGTDFLEIRASRRKDEWVAPKTVRVGEVYYRLEQTWMRGGGRPFTYVLRKLDAGVPGRGVILYRVH
jgi:hypothetical protein